MANMEHVQIVKRGRDVVARWREEHPGEPLDLNASYMSYARLPQVDLTGAQKVHPALKGAVGGFEKAVGGGAIIGEQGDADAGADFSRAVAIHVERLAHHRHDFAGPGGNDGEGLYIAQHHHEFIAAAARRQIRFPDAALEERMPCRRSWTTSNTR